MKNQSTKARKLTVRQGEVLGKLNQRDARLYVNNNSITGWAVFDGRVHKMNYRRKTIESLITHDYVSPSIFNVDGKVIQYTITPAGRQALNEQS